MKLYRNAQGRLIELDEADAVKAGFVEENEVSQAALLKTALFLTAVVCGVIYLAWWS